MLDLHSLALLIALLLTALVAYPLLIFVWLGWQRKADDIVLSLTDEAAALYLQVFQNRRQMKRLQKRSKNSTLAGMVADI